MTGFGHNRSAAGAPGKMVNLWYHLAFRTLAVARDLIPPREERIAEAPA
jgi:hypothetical protein